MANNILAKNGKCKIVILAVLIVAFTFIYADFVTDLYRPKPNKTVALHFEQYPTPEEYFKAWENQTGEPYPYTSGLNDR